jgi:pimeloyl-ACP methyl ester carboxylesterase
MMLGMTRALALVAAVLLALIGASSAEAAKKPEKGPGGLSFYEPPAELPKGHGRLIWYRKAGGLVPLEGAKWNRNVLYTTKSPQRDRVSVSGTVSIPEGKAPKGGFPVITYAHGTTGVADACAPSRNAAGGPVIPYVEYVYPQLSAFLDAGYAVLRTDYQGLGTPGPHPYLIGKSEGRSVLDIVRAAQELSPKIGDDYAIAGHSQGGHAALFAAGMADNWVPEQNLAGTIAYAPASHLKEQAQAIEGLTSPSGLTALATLILYGASTANTGVQPDVLMTPETYAFWPDLDETCLPELGESDSLGGYAPADLLRDGANTNTLFNVLDRNNPAVTTSAPILLAQGEADTTVFPVFTNLLDDELQALNDSVDYQKYPGVTHGEIVAAAQPQALEFLAETLPTG